MASRNGSTLEELSKLCDVSSNFRNYREELRKWENRENGEEKVPLRFSSFYSVRFQNLKNAESGRKNSAPSSLEGKEGSSKEELIQEEGRLSTIVPWLGVFLKDFSAIEEGQATFVGEKINMKKMRAIARLRKSLKAFQRRCQYSLMPVPFLQKYLVEEALVLKEEELDKIALRICPRVFKRKFSSSASNEDD